MKIITYNDETVPWGRSNHLMGTKLLPSSDDKPHRTRTKLMIKKATAVTWTAPAQIV
jgi:hypothetical protein